MNTTIGFTGYEWKTPRRRCAKCNRRLLRGVVNITQVGKEHEPGFKVLCWDCYNTLPKSRAEAGDTVPLGESEREGAPPTPVVFSTKVVR